jgi:hypothetical protein
VAVFEAYYDHSYTGTGTSAAVTLAVLVAPATVWEKFAVAWDAAMERGGAADKVLHMKELVHGVGDWVGWDVKRQTALFRKLVPVVRKHVSYGFCLSYPQAFHDNVTRINERPDQAQTPLMELFQACLEAIKAHVLRIADEPVHSYIEEDRLVEADVTRHFYWLTHARGWERHFPTIRPLPKGPSPLQAADMVAYEGSRHASEHDLATGRAWAGIGSRPAARRPRQLYLELKRSHQLHFSTLTLESFKRLAEKTVIAGQYLRDNPELKASLDRHFTRAVKQTQRERSALGSERKKARQARRK